MKETTSQEIVAGQPEQNNHVIKGEVVLERSSESSSLMAIIERAASAPEYDVAKLTALLDVKERWDANEARKAYNAAMKRFKANPPEITKNKHVEFGQTKYNHATLDHVCDVVTKALSEVGISHAWRVTQDKEFITVICVLTHEMGHSEQTQMMGSPDNSGSKNSIQAIGSTTTYLSRYTLLAACGLAASNDTDGKVPDAPQVDADKLEEYLRQMTEVETMEQLKVVFAKAYNEAQDASDRAAMARLIALKNKRKAEIDAAH